MSGSLKIKIPRRGLSDQHKLKGDRDNGGGNGESDVYNNNNGVMSKRPSFKRYISPYSDDEDEVEHYSASPHDPEELLRRKRARTSLSLDEDPDLDVDAHPNQYHDHEQEREPDPEYLNPRDQGHNGDVDVDIDVDYVPDHPDPPSASGQSPPRVRRNSRTTRRPDYRAMAGETSSRRKPSSASKPKRAVVYSDDEDEEYANEDVATRDRSGEEDEQEYDPDSAPRRGSSKRTRGGSFSLKGGKGRGAKSLEKEILVREERRAASATRSPSPSAQPSKRSYPDDDGDVAADFSATSTKTGQEKTVLPAFKKRKLPTIKKNKPPVGATGSSAGPSTPVPKQPPQTSEKPPESERLPLSLPRKVAVGTPRSDFDLRDASVYAQLFQKPGGMTPNSGLNRKEKEEERRKELNRMRDEARAKRMTEAKYSFNLQAAHEKIARFEEKLHARKSLAAFPNILGAAFKEMHDKKRKQAMEFQK